MNASEQRSIRITFILISCALSIGAYKFYPSIKSYVGITVAIILFLTSLFHPPILRPLFKIWLRIGRIAGKFNTRIVLGLIFFLVFSPSGLIMRLLGRDFMKRRFSEEKSYWEDYKLSGLDDKGRYERQF